jgi:VanZ family protein
MKHFLRYKFPAVLWAIVIYIASSIPGAKMPRFIHHINDKLLHISVFFVLGLLVYLALEPRAKTPFLNWKRCAIAVLVVVVYGMTDEFHQAFVPGRTVDILDVTADTIGGLLAAAVVIIGSRFKEPDDET